MNLFPFVMIIVFILSMFSLAQFQRNHSLKREKDTYIAYFKGLREVRNSLESEAYTKAKKSSPDRTHSQKPSKDKKSTQHFFRDKNIGCSNGRLNIFSLLDKTQNNTELKKTCIQYLRALYGHNKFFPVDPTHLLDSIIAKLREEEHPPPLHTLKLDDSEMHNLFYKVLKGTHTYNIKTKEGYPPFDHFFTFEKGQTSPMNFHAANEIFLEVVLGKSITKELIKKEKELKRAYAAFSPLSIADVQDFTKNIHPNPIGLFAFTPPKAEKQPKIHVDTQTKITVRIK